MVKISVIIPVYNVEKYLEKSLQSILTQTLEDIEVICINDASTDDSFKILQNIAKNDSRVKIVNNNQNLSAGVSRNLGIKIAGGEYLTFVDPDDWIGIERFEKMYKLAKIQDADIVETSFVYYRERFKRYKNSETKFSENLNIRALKKYLFEYSFDPWCKLYKTSLIKENGIEFFKGNYAEVVPFTFKARFSSQKIVFLDSKDYFYRVRNSSLMNSLNYSVLNIIDILAELRKFMSERDFCGHATDFEEFILNNLVFANSRIPKERYKFFNSQLLDFLTEEEYKAFIKKSKMKNSFVERIFSIKNEYKFGFKYKVLTVFGLKFSFEYEN